MNTNSRCPVCDQPGAIPAPDGNATHYRCYRCGDFTLSGIAESMLQGKKALETKLAAALSYRIRQYQRHNQRPFISSDVITQLVKSPFLPGPAEQAENLLLWVADEIETPGAQFDIDMVKAPAVIGARDDDGVHFIVNALIEKRLLSGTAHDDGATVALSFNGWESVDQLRRKSSQGIRAFMAMAFGNHDLADIVEQHFKPAVQAAGFHLFRLDEDPRAGSIDERLRVEIRRSAFVVADLTDANLGAYWEAGFGEGLGKPVIYTCEKEAFDSQGTHFDTNHLHTVLWAKDEPESAAEGLKATIRATIPYLAKMDDD